MTETRLSVNLNKIALVRNARGIGIPDLVEAARWVIDAGCHGLTVHPRADQRHATLEDVRRLAALEAVADGRVELNVEGDPRPDLLEVVREVMPTQLTLVPVVPGELTTEKGWRSRQDEAMLRQVLESFEGRLRTSLFVDAAVEGVHLAADVGADAIELHTYDYAHAYGTERQAEVLARYEEAARVARERGLRVHAGHDLNQENVGLLVERLRPEELSIGHALTADALAVGMPVVTGRYLEAIAEPWSRQ